MPPTEDELRALLQGGDASGQIDVDEVLRRARRRRRPRVALVTAAGVLAVAAIAVPVTIGITGPGVATTSAASESSVAGAADSGAAPEADGSGDTLSSQEGLRRAPAEKLNLCTGALADVAPAESGLVLSVAPVDAAATDTSIPVVVTMTNTGSETVTGTTSAAPALTLSRDGVTLWHSNGAQIMLAVEVDLAPGASLQYATTFEPVVCGVDDDLGDSFRPALPAAGPGAYDLSAAIVLMSGTGEGELVSSPLTPIALR